MDTKKDINIKNLRIFSLILSGILAIFSVKFCKLGNISAGGIFLAVSLTAFSIGILQPRLIMPVHRTLSFIGKKVGFIVTTFLFGVIFYCVFTPIGVILRLTKRDLLGMEIDKEKNSYWVERSNRDIKPESLDRQF